MDKEIQKDVLLKQHSLTIGDLKKFISNKNFSDDTIVVVQRVEDLYYNNHGWKTYRKYGESANNLMQWNEDVLSGKYKDKRKYPNVDPEDLTIVPQDEIDFARDQYTAAHCCVYYKEDPEILFINLHY